MLSSRKNDHTHKVSFSSSCHRIISLLQSPPCLHWILPRVGDNVTRLIAREGHNRVHLLHHKLQVLHSSVLFRIRRQELEINRRRRDFRRLLSGPLQHHLRLLDHTGEESLRLLRPCWKSSSKPVNSLGRPRPFTSMRLGASFRT